MKKVLKVLLLLVLAVVLALGALIGWLSATEYKPASIEALRPLRSEASEKLAPGAELNILSWNIGYAGLGKGSDFVMDGGTHMRAADKATVQQYLAGIDASLREGDYDLVLLQEVDVDSARTYGIDESETLAFGDAYVALNYSCGFVPNPSTYLIDPMGKVHSGLLTCSRYEVASAERHALPCPFSWPLRIVNLKRCLLVERLPIEGSEKELVLVNLHLEAYDDGEGKIAQTRQLMELLREEYAKGNYVIAAGDFNQSFPHALETYPNTHPELWTPGVIEGGSQPEGFAFFADLDVPSCRLLNQPYDPADTVNTQYYVIDGYLFSENVAINEAETLDLGFENSDHNPVRLNVTLK